MDFTLSQSITVCDGAPYVFWFATTSACESASSCYCTMTACIGDTCLDFDPPTGGSAQFGMAYNAPVLANGDGSQETVMISVAPLCEREYVRFTSASLELDITNVEDATDPS